MRIFLFTPLLVLAACSSTAYEAVKDSEITKVCADGTLVGYNKELKRYTVAQDYWTGIVSADVKLEDICQAVK